MGKILAFIKENASIVLNAVIGAIVFAYLETTHPEREPFYSIPYIMVLMAFISIVVAIYKSQALRIIPGDNDESPIKKTAMILFVALLHAVCSFLLMFIPLLIVGGIAYLFGYK